MVDRTNQSTSGQENPEYQYDWQNPNLNTFDFGRMMGRTFRGAMHCSKAWWLPLLLAFGLPTFLISLWPMLLADGAYADLLSGGGFESFGEFFTPAIIVGAVVAYVVFILMTAALYVGISHNIYGFYIGNTPSLQRSLKRGMSRLGGAIVAGIVFLLGVAFGFVLLIIPGVLLVLGWYLVTPVLAIEDKGPLESLGRSWEMSKGSKRWILLFFVILMVISGVSQALFSLIALPFGSQATALLEGGSAIFWILNALGATLSQILVLLLTVAGLTSIYYEIRDVKEGAVQESLSAVFD